MLFSSTNPWAVLRTLFLGLTVCGGVLAQANLLVNGNAETGSLVGWTDALGNGFNVGTLPHTGTYAFTGGVSGPVGALNNELRQDVDVVGLAAAIDSGAITAVFGGWGRTNEAGGFPDPASVGLEFRSAGGTVLASYSTGVFQPYNAWHPFADTRPVPVGTRTLRVRLLCSRQIGSSTDGFFDDLTLGLQQWEAVGSGCTGGNGVPALSLVNAPWIGQTYTLSVSNLAGGLALMVTGLSSWSLPLQPLGLGFGPSCLLQATPDALAVLAQVGGSASWSLVIPNLPTLAGMSLWNQAAELATVSAVSNVGHAVLR